MASDVSFLDPVLQYTYLVLNPGTPLVFPSLVKPRQVKEMVSPFCSFNSRELWGVFTGPRMFPFPHYRPSPQDLRYSVRISHFEKFEHPQKALFVDSNTFVQKLHVLFVILHKSMWCFR